MASPKGAFQIRELLWPHKKALRLGLLAVMGETLADVLQPWPLKIVLDNVLRDVPIHGWLNRLVLTVAGTDKLAILKLAAVAVLGIAALDAVCSYWEKSVT